MTEDTFAARLRTALSGSRLRTQRALAEASGIDVTYLSRLFNGKVAQPSYDTVRRLAEALGVGIGDLAPYFVVQDVAHPLPAGVGTSEDDGVELAVLEVDQMSDAEAVAFVEGLPGRYHHRMLADERQLRTDESYARFCRGILRAWVSNRQAALEAARSARE